MGLMSVMSRNSSCKQTSLFLSRLPALVVTEGGCLRSLLDSVCQQKHTRKHAHTHLHLHDLNYMWFICSCPLSVSPPSPLTLLPSSLRWTVVGGYDPWQTLAGSAPGLLPSCHHSWGLWGRGCHGGSSAAGWRALVMGLAPQVTRVT